MKRLVTLGITLALVMGLFCFSVNADNIVIQGESDTVTATYGSNDITIALRARKLRVINTGTAAAGYAGYTPVIVSVTIYNLGNQNCLVNNLKFRLTSESAEYRIAGFENISPDLFISDTAYDATGYLSLKASNDYTYGGGFVVPANSNMTYVGIINVSANWITENQTWRTVDLSTATFYDNLTTTVGDYPCDAEPVDLSNIETDIDSILTTVQGIDLDVSSTYTLIQNLLAATVYTGAVPSNIGINGNRTIVSGSFANGNMTYNVQRDVGSPYYYTVDYEYDNTDDTASLVGSIVYPVTLYIRTVNNRSVYSVNWFDRLDNVFPSGTFKAIYLRYMYSEQYSDVYANNNNLTMHYKVRSDSGSGLVPTGTSVTILQFDIIVDANITPVFDAYTLTVLTDPVIYSGLYVPKTEFQILRDLFIAYSSVNGIDDLSDAATDAADQAETIHNQEASYYAQNQAAIEATGLSNYQFSGEQTNGIGAVSNDFTALWNALGSWNSVYIFSMTLTLALTILRHMPNRRRPKEDKKE